MQPQPLLQLGRQRRLCLRLSGRPCLPGVHRYVAARTASIPTKEEVPDKVPSADVVQLLNNAVSVSTRDHAEIAAALESVYHGVPSVVPWHEQQPQQQQQQHGPEVHSTISGAQLDGQFRSLKGHSNRHASASSSSGGGGTYLNGHVNGSTVDGGLSNGCVDGHSNGARLNGTCSTCQPSEAHANGAHLNGHSDAHHTLKNHANGHQTSSSSSSSRNREELTGQGLMLDPRVHLQVVLPPGIIPDALDGHGFSGRQGSVNCSSSSSTSSLGAQAALTIAPPAAAPPQQQQQVNGHATETQAGLTLPLLAPSLDGAASDTGDDHSSSGNLSGTSSGELSSSSSTASASPAAAPVTDEDAEVEPPPGTIPQSILILSIISASLTLASCVFNTALPIYMVTELKMSMRSMGMFEGLLEAFSYIVRMFSGVVSDAMTSRKAAITLGFAMGAAAKFGMSCSGAVTQLFAFKAMDRLANGVQAAPRDALIGDLSPASSRSACFGFAQSMRKWGSSIGALMCYFLMKASKNNYQVVFTTAASISLASCIAFVLLVPAHPRVKARSPAAAGGAAGKAEQQQQQQAGFSLGKFFADVRSLGTDFYRMVATISLYALGHLNESLLEARCIEVGFGKAESTLVVCALAAVTFLCAYPLGRVDDEHGPRVTFAIGMGALIMGNLILLTSSAFPMAVFVSCVFLGLHYAILQGPILSSVVRLSPPHLRGTAFGVFYTVMALTAVVANTIFGTVWHAYTAQHAFALSAIMTTCTLLVLPKLLPQQAAAPPQEQRMAMAAA